MTTIDLLAFGEALLDFFPDTRGGYDGVRSFAVWPGGAPSNVAYGVAAAGLQVAFLGKVGPGWLGDAVLSRMREAGIDARYMTRTEKTPTGLTFVRVELDGERSFFPYRHLAADKEIGPEDIPEAPFERARVVHLGANCMALPPSWDATERVVALAKAHGRLLSFDPNLRPHYHLKDPTVMQRVRELAAQAHIVKMNRDEARALYGGSRAAVEALFTGDTEIAVVTRDQDGAAWWTRDGREGTHPGFPSDALDATGAGDAFMAGLLAVLLERPAQGSPLGTEPHDHEALRRLPSPLLERAVEVGNLFGASCVSAYGATASWPEARRWTADASGAR
jgi:fructokinase